MQFMGIWSLNYFLKTLLRLSHTPILQKFTPTTCMGVTIRVDQSVSPQHIKVLVKYLAYI
jgi:hypothetical protein